MIVVADGWKRCGGQCRRFMRRQDYYRWTDSRDGRLRTSRLCKRCTRARNRENYRRRMADPYMAAAERKRNREYKRNRLDPRNAARCQKYRERLRADPEKYGQQLADTRIRRRLAGDLSDPPARTRATIAAYGSPSRAEVVPAAPLVGFLRMQFPGWSPGEIASVHGGIIGRRLLDVFNGRQDNLALDAVDRFLTIGMGRPDLLNALYPVGPR